MSFHQTRLAHIHKISQQNYEKRLGEVLLARITAEELRAYREAYHSSYDMITPSPEKLNTITINLTELCNFKCAMCDVPGNNGKELRLPVDKILEFMSAAAENGAKCCMLGSGSEITLFKEWHNILSSAVKLFPDTILFTNGSLLSPSDLEYIVRVGVTRVFISLDAARPTTFRQIRGFDILEKIEDSILRLIRIREELKSLTPLVRVSFVVQNENTNEADEFVDKWISRVDSVELQDCLDISNFKDRTYANSLPVIDDRSISFQPQCHYPFSYLSLWANGSISPCCTSYGRDSTEIHVASLLDQDFMSQAIAKRELLQEAFRSRNWSKIPNTCKHCLLNQRNVSQEEITISTASQ